MRLIFFAALALSYATVAFGEAGRIPSVPFNEGWLGTEGSNPQQNLNVIDLLVDEAVEEITFSQPSSQAGGEFIAQGNDVPGLLTLYTSSGQVYHFDGSVVWVDKEGGVTQSIGFIVSPLENQAMATVTVDGSTPSYNNFTLELIGNLASYPEGTELNWGTGANNISGSADTRGIADILNAYLTSVEANRPTGPVSVTPLTVDTATEIQLTGEAVLGSGESLVVEVDGVTYTPGDGYLTSDGSTWTLTLPAGSKATGTYEVTATITNSDGYSLSDTTSNELIVTEVGAAPAIIVSGNATPIADGDTTPSTSDLTDFGAADISSGSITNQFTICNNAGTAPLSITDISISGTDAADFSVSNLSSSILAPDECATFDVTFDPSTEGTKGATVTISSNGGDGQHSFDISGHGTSLSGTGTISGTATRDNTGEGGVTANLYELVDGTYQFVRSTETAADGTYTFSGLDSGTYAVSFQKAGSVIGADTISTMTSDGIGLDGIVVANGPAIQSIVVGGDSPSIINVDANLVDPSGVVYDATTRQPISGAIVTLQRILVDGSIVDVSSSQVNGGANPLITGTDGSYAFQFSDPAPSGLYTIKVEASGYETINGATIEFSSVLPASLNDGGIDGLNYVSQGRVAVATGTQTIEVVGFQTAPTTSQSVRYYMLFDLIFEDWADATTLSRGIVNNHLPMNKITETATSVDILLPMIQDDLTTLLESDRASTLTRESNSLSAISASLLDELSKAGSPSGIGSAACSQLIESARHDRKIYFEIGSDKLAASAEPILRDVALAIQSCGGARIEIAGHTDNSGSFEYNKVLSEKRALAVKHAILSFGQTQAELIARGYGEAYPVASNETLEGRSLNRRVEFLPLDANGGDADCGAFKMGLPTMTGSAGYNTLAANARHSLTYSDCLTNSWFHEESRLSFAASDEGLQQWAVDATLGYSRLVTPHTILGSFASVYGSSAQTNQLAEGVINGYGGTIALAGASRAYDSVYLDYYAGLAAGRHNYDLAFERAWTIDASGSYDYWAGFAGAALSGELQMVESRARPRAGVSLIYSPSTSANVTSTTLFETEVGSVELAKASLIRGFGEFQLERDGEFMFWGETNLTASASSAPRFYCERNFGDKNLNCGYGAWLELATEAEKSSSRMQIRLDAEKEILSDAWQGSIQIGFTQGFLGDQGIWSSNVGLNGTNGLVINQSIKIDF